MKSRNSLGLMERRKRKRKEKRNHAPKTTARQSIKSIGFKKKKKRLQGLQLHFTVTVTAKDLFAWRKACSVSAMEFQFNNFSEKAQPASYKNLFIGERQQTIFYFNSNIRNVWHDRNKSFFTAIEENIWEQTAATPVTSLGMCTVLI